MIDRFLSTLVVSLGIASSVLADAPVAATTLWYDRPAKVWTEALLVGNGRLGAMVFGGIAQERLQINEDTVWGGGPYDPSSDTAFAAYAKARALIFAGKPQEAADEVAARGMATPVRQAPYQTVGSLMLDFPGLDESKATNYRRELDVDTAVATTTFKIDGVTYKREVFASAPDQVIVIRLSADQPGKIAFKAGWQTPLKISGAAIDPHGRLTLTATTGDFPA